MYLVAIAWLYVAVMMAIAEATHSQGSLLGAIITFLLYGVLPLSVVLYVMGAPLRRRQRLQQDQQQSQVDLPDAVPKTPADHVQNR
jgi:membrane protein implicated in regulation of membrane protease activity